MRRVALLAAVAAALAGNASASIFDLTLSGDSTQFSETKIPFQGLLFDEFSVNLTGLDSTDAITVAQGDTINTTVTFTSPVTIPMSVTRTDILQFLTGSSFPNENTGVTGVFSFFDGGVPVGVFNFDSSTSGELASFSSNSPPTNGAFTFNSYTASTTITALPTPATLDGAQFEYSLDSPLAAPEPAAWALMLVGFGLVGGLARACVARRDSGFGRSNGRFKRVAPTIA